MSEDNCHECNAEINNEDYIGEYEERGEYWGAPCNEYVVTGYICPECGFRGVF